MSQQHDPTGKPASSSGSSLSSGGSLAASEGGIIRELIAEIQNAKCVEDVANGGLALAAYLARALPRPPAEPSRLFPEPEDADKSVRTLCWLAQIVGGGRFREMQPSEGEFSVVDPLEPAAKQRIARVLNRAADQLREVGARPPAEPSQGKIVIDPQRAIELTSAQLARIWTDLKAGADRYEVWATLNDEDRFTLYALLVDELESQRAISRPPAEPSQHEEKTDQDHAVVPVCEGTPTRTRPPEIERTER